MVEVALCVEAAGHPDDRILAAAIVTLGHGLGLKVIAEGVEIDEQRRILLDQGCDLAQGYWFSRPLPAAEFSAWLQRETLLIHHGFGKATTKILLF